MNPRLTVDSLRTVYDSEEFYEGREKNINYYSFLSGERYLRRTAAGRIGRFRRFAKGRKLLEVASAAGFFLAEAKDAGFDAEGIEISRPMAAYASKRWEVPVQGESIEDADLAPEAYDVIASWGVMTIIRDPRAVIEKFHSALKPGGVWAFNTYDNRSLWGRLFRGHVVHPGREHQPDPQRPDPAAPARRRRASTWWPAEGTGPTPAWSGCCSCCSRTSAPACATDSSSGSTS